MSKTRELIRSHIHIRSPLYRALHSRSHYRPRFLSTLRFRADVFDIGCGNDSPYIYKLARPDIRYVGLDVADYGQRHDPNQYADEYLVVAPNEFLQTIQERPNQFDVVTSNHNLEHCSDPERVVTAMSRALRPNGRIFLAFPSAASEKLPSRGGTLNFCDDSTHISPPNYQSVLALLDAEGIEIDFAAERYRPFGWVALGLLNEPLSRARNRVLSGTWALYGFESIIWGTKRNPPSAR